MQTGPSRELFELWAPDSRNGLIVTGYSIEGTLARVSDNRLVSRDGYVRHFISFVNNTNQLTLISFTRLPGFSFRKLFTVHISYNRTHLFSRYIQDILNEPEEFTSLKGTTIPRKISVDYISFSAHVDYSQNSEFIEQVKAQHVVSSM